MLYDNFFIYLYHICGGVIEKCFWISILLVSYMFYWLKYYYIDICLLIYMSWDKKEKKSQIAYVFSKHETKRRAFDQETQRLKHDKVYREVEQS